MIAAYNAQSYYAKKKLLMCVDTKRENCLKLDGVWWFRTMPSGTISERYNMKMMYCPHDVTGTTNAKATMAG
jgi:hypothetical protein